MAGSLNLALDRRPALARVGSFDDLRAIARRRLPKMVFEFVEGGAGAEVTLRANREAIERLRFDPSWLVDVSGRDTSTTVLGQRVALPYLLAPAGLAALVHRDAELAAARAAGAAGTIFCVSTASSCSLEEIAAVASGPLWFQLYLWGDDAVVEGLVARAEAAGCHALVLTVDTPVVGNRERDVRNGASLPPLVRFANAVDVARHPRWLHQLVTGPSLAYGNLQPLSGGASALGAMVALTDTTATWERVAALRRRWDGPLVVKGVLSARDAREAVRHGADAVYVSNHGGRQLDSSPATFAVLPSIVEAVGDRAEVLVDGGVRRGEDVVKARALGATACLVGRPWFLALAAGGQAGVARMLEVVRADIDRTLALVGVPTVDGVTADALASAA